MNKYDDILYDIHMNTFSNQREIAARTGFSLGFVNAALKKLQAGDFLQREGKRFELTEDGIRRLEAYRQKMQGQKLMLRSDNGTVRQAVILAAGGNAHFQMPVGLLAVHGESLLQRIVKILKEQGIEEICVVIGYGKEQIREHLEGQGIRMVENNHYQWTGTMASLACATNWITGDFLLVESNQIFEETAIREIYHCRENNAMLMVSPSGSMDEAYVELDVQGNIFRISKDIRQVNRIDGELVGISKISYELYRKMLEYYSHNENPMINYEYVMESLGHTYGIPAVVVDDLQWGVIENQQHYEYAESRLYSRIRKKELLRRENAARQTFAQCMNIPQEAILDFHVSGGMTNTNFYVRTDAGAYILRIPGVGTQQMVDRHLEQVNSRLGERLGVNVPIVYFDEISGVKITRYIEAARTLNPKSARLEPSMRKTAGLIARLHTCGEVMENHFRVGREYEKYKTQAQQVQVRYYDGFAEMDRWFYALLGRLEQLGEDCVPCHNDLVAENFIDGRDGRRYLIDWEYAGMNDPMWDLAAHLLECGFTHEEEELFLQYYFKEKMKKSRTSENKLEYAWKKEEVGTFLRKSSERILKQDKNGRISEGNRELTQKHMDKAGCLHVESIDSSEKNNIDSYIGISEVNREKIAIYKMLQDILWSIWTMIKEAKGEDFGTYGIDRLKRAIDSRKEYERHYEIRK